jgi:hypothetical protein
MNEKDDDIAHPGMLSKPEKHPDFAPIQHFAMDRCLRKFLRTGALFIRSESNDGRHASAAHQ